MSSGPTAVGISLSMSLYLLFLGLPLFFSSLRRTFQPGHFPLRLALGVPASVLWNGHSYRVRYTVGNGRGLVSAGPWREFTYRLSGRRGGPGAETDTSAAAKHKAAKPRARTVVRVGRRITLRGQRLTVPVTCVVGPCRTTATVRTRGARPAVMATRRVTVRARRTAQVTLRLTRAGRRAVAARRRVPVTVLVRAGASSAGRTATLRR